ncbi:sugar kinase [Fusobacterium sp. IOR10]|uniref:sugar kinase n=1 Tax=Fusobacterium sp. IOR10 TaxID=2665157 RepID=UPI0013D7FC90|nr:sugar kinase [Fusobacterium sp. IOR10]
MFDFKNRKFDVISCGEVIMRLSPQEGKLLSQEGKLNRYLGGAELNVLSGISNLGCSTSFISKIPSHDLGIYAEKSMNINGVNSDYLVYDNTKNSRLAIYYYEYGSSPRKPNVVYDRHNSSFQFLDIKEIDNNVYNQTKIFHISGISLGLCENSKKLTKDLIKKFKESGALISFDINFRRNLWASEENAKEEILKIIPYIDILFASEETLRKMFGQVGTMKKIMKNFSKEYNIPLIISSQRTINSPKSHNFTSTIYSEKNNEYYFEAPYNNIDVIDRIGSGDAFVSGILFGLIKYNNIQKSLKFGNALGSLKNTVFGDSSCFSLKLVENIINDHENGSDCEMNR